MDSWLLHEEGFLVCVPMLEEWRSGDGIEVLDGWTFQVYHLFTYRSNYGPHVPFTQFSSESVRPFPEMTYANIVFYQITRLL